MVNDKRNKFIQILDCPVKLVILLVLTVVVLFLFMTCIVKTVHIEGDMNLTFLSDSPVKNGMCILAFAVLAVSVKAIAGKFFPCFVVWAQSHRRRICVAVTLVVAVFLVWWISVTRFSPTSDQYHCFNYAGQLLAGDSSAWAYDYMSVYPFQNGLVFYDAGLLLLFGDNAYYAFQYLNVVWFLLAAWCVYGISVRMFKKDSVWFFLSVALFYPIQMYVVFCYGTLMGLALSMLSVYLLMRYFDDRRTATLIVSGIAIAISIIVKSNYAIVLVGMLLYLFYDAFRGHWKKSIFGILIMLCLVLGISKGFYGIVERVTGVPVSDGIPKIAWVAMGLQEMANSPGWFNAYNGYVYEQNGRDTDATVQECIENIQANLETFKISPVYAKYFFSKKLTSEWSNPTWECFNMQERESHSNCDWAVSLVNEPYLGVWEKLLDVLQTIINCGFVLYVASRWKNFRNLTVYELVNAVMLIGAFIFLIFWEAKSQYAAPYYYLALPYAAYGWMCFTGWVSKIKFRN